MQSVLFRAMAAGIVSADLLRVQTSRGEKSGASVKIYGARRWDFHFLVLWNQIGLVPRYGQLITIVRIAHDGELTATRGGGGSIGGDDSSSLRDECFATSGYLRPSDEGSFGPGFLLGSRARRRGHPRLVANQHSRPLCRVYVQTYPLAISLEISDIIRSKEKLERHHVRVAVSLALLHHVFGQEKAGSFRSVMSFYRRGNLRLFYLGVISVYMANCIIDRGKAA